ncbi:MAG: D-tyrosyl-tRNA(Tyr) deacylase [Deltaproteobacteria bacterium]|jgi:D-aminoacyl-tRNA deacylase|nr:D-tyrosyl-tRNA(Tyr) deacylase [Deltaproteobacteria bacterium]MBT6434578.1 D-tyrosyl-tRNA(Tyr) deacylase [Deltaproteobacteria bacterium]MBT6488880.1 D-tyrosyl-tRNA(Tyr) deacylase [Deltaproteobacteria bacterium]
MKAVCQRVSEASVKVEGNCIGKIQAGILILLGIGPQDNKSIAKALALKIAGLRIFPDDADRMNLSLQDIAGGCLIVSQFTLYGDCKKGRRPFFGGAAHPQLATELCDVFTEAMRELIDNVETGQFGASMEVSLVNDGPVTLVLDSDELGLS